MLQFPWNFQYVLEEAEEMPMVAENSYWHKFMVNTRSIVDYNTLYREFHQACAIPDYQMLERICEPRLAKTVAESLKRIHFHGLDVEMANLTIEQPSIRIIKAEVHQNLSINRDENMQSLDAYDVSNNQSISGAPWKTYAPKDSSKDTRHIFDVLGGETHAPYLVQLTCLVDSPMKLYVQNQNFSKILFGNDDEESVKNVIKFEANLKWYDFFNMLPVDNKKSLNWKITDFNSVLNENPLFPEEE